MHIALIGYGKMGRTIEALGLDQGHSFPLIIDIDNSNDLNPDRLKGVDVAIEFTTPVSAPGNILTCIDHHVPVVSGTTGWNERFKEIEDHCMEHHGAFFYASNFSIGVNILFAMNKKLARIMDRFSEYAASMTEVHHIHKLDTPSGTAITLAEQIIKEHGQINNWSLQAQEDPASLHIDAIRKGEVKGKHTICYESDVDSLTLSHDAKSRDAFAAGALLAAGFIKDQTGVFGMKDLLKL
ncbi:MAG: 4-hydroxy-tetrahydrodipicolinate reductase [Bacteroidales bacterium]|nr:4-hydroxy-tetrahydrodipicolinate reductase [Bacteroidales bacterium]